MILLNRKLKIGIVVGEVSGDTLGAKLIRRFREQGIDAEFEGIGGPQMIAEGFKSYYPMDILSVMGIVEVLKDIKKLFAVRDGLVETWTNKPVDIFVGIDAPDFNLRLSKTIKQKNLPIKTVQYVFELDPILKLVLHSQLGFQEEVDLPMDAQQMLN